MLNNGLYCVITIIHLPWYPGNIHTIFGIFPLILPSCKCLSKTVNKEVAKHNRFIWLACIIGLHLILNPALSALTVYPTFFVILSFLDKKPNNWTFWRLLPSVPTLNDKTVQRLDESDCRHPSLIGVTPKEGTRIKWPQDLIWSRVKRGKNPFWCGSYLKKDNSSYFIFIQQ